MNPELQTILLGFGGIALGVAILLALPIVLDFMDDLKYRRIRARQIRAADKKYGKLK